LQRHWQDLRRLIGVGHRDFKGMRNFSRTVAGLDSEAL